MAFGEGKRKSYGQLVPVVTPLEMTMQGWSDSPIPGSASLLDSPGEGAGKGIKLLGGCRNCIPAELWTAPLWASAPGIWGPQVDQTVLPSFVVEAKHFQG